MLAGVLVAVPPVGSNLWEQYGLHQDFSYPRNAMTGLDVQRSSAAWLYGRGVEHPIVVTLGTMTIYRGLLVALSGGETIGGLPPAFVAFANARILGVNASAALGGAAALMVYVWLAHLRSGRHLVALSKPLAKHRSPR